MSEPIYNPNEFPVSSLKQLEVQEFVLNHTTWHLGQEVELKYEMPRLAGGPHNIGMTYNNHWKRAKVTQILRVASKQYNYTLDLVTFDKVHDPYETGRAFLQFEINNGRCDGLTLKRLLPEFKADDKVRVAGRDGVYEILNIDGDKAWMKGSAPSYFYLHSLSHAYHYREEELVPGSLWLHPNTGGLYVVLGIGTCSTNGERDQKERSVIYWSTAKLKLCYREIGEFLDGRFVPVSGSVQQLKELP